VGPVGGPWGLRRVGGFVFGALAVEASLLRRVLTRNLCTLYILGLVDSPLVPVLFWLLLYSIRSHEEHCNAPFVLAIFFLVVLHVISLLLGLLMRSWPLLLISGFNR